MTILNLRLKNCGACLDLLEVKVSTYGNLFVFNLDLANPK